MTADLNGDHRLRRIVFLTGAAEATVLTHDGVAAAAVRDVLELDRFAAAVATAAGVEVEVAAAGTGRPEPAAGTVWVADYTVVSPLLEGAPAAGLAARLVELHLPRPGALEYLAETRLAGAVEVGQYLRWKSAPSAPGTAGLFGRREVAGAIGAQVSLPEGDYGTLFAERLPHLPELLAAYLTAYVEQLESGRLKP